MDVSCMRRKKNKRHAECLKIAMIQCCGIHPKQTHTVMLHSKVDASLEWKPWIWWCHDRIRVWLLFGHHGTCCTGSLLTILSIIYGVVLGHSRMLIYVFSLCHPDRMWSIMLLIARHADALSVSLPSAWSAAGRELLLLDVAVCCLQGWCKHVATMTYVDRHDENTGLLTLQ